MSDKRRKFWRVEIPREWIVSSDSNRIMSALDGYTGTVHVHDGDFMRNMIEVGGEHDPADQGSQAAVARLVEAVYPRRRRSASDNPQVVATNPPDGV